MTPLVYAGTLYDGGSAVDGPRTIGAKLWSDVSSTVSTDTRCTTAAVPVAVTQGRFRLPLDPSCAAAVHAFPDLWIELTIDGTVLPREHLGATPYALEADRAAGADRFVVASELDVRGDVTMMREPMVLAFDTDYVATTDGFVMQGNGGSGATGGVTVTVTMPSGANWSCRYGGATTTNYYDHMTCPVPRGATWRAHGWTGGPAFGSVAWLPFGR